MSPCSHIKRPPPSACNLTNSSSRAPACRATHTPYGPNTSTQPAASLTPRLRPSINEWEWRFDA